MINTPWPKLKKELLAKETIVLAIQINGKLKATVSAPINANEDESIDLAMSSTKVKKSLGDKKIRKTIHVPNKIINFVV